MPVLDRRFTLTSRTGERSVIITILPRGRRLVPGFCELFGLCLSFFILCAELVDLRVAPRALKGVLPRKRLEGGTANDNSQPGRFIATTV